LTCLSVSGHQKVNATLLLSFISSSLREIKNPVTTNLFSANSLRETNRAFGNPSSPTVERQHAVGILTFVRLVSLFNHSAKRSRGVSSILLLLQTTDRSASAEDYNALPLSSSSSSRSTSGSAMISCLIDLR